MLEQIRVLQFLDARYVRRSIILHQEAVMLAEAQIPGVLAEVPVHGAIPEVPAKAQDQANDLVAAIKFLK
jgi:hypothetical protein